MRRICSAAAIVALGFFAQTVLAAQNPVGNWNIKIKVGHVGEGIRPVVLEIKEAEGKLSARMSKLNGAMEDVDEMTYKDGKLSIVMGSYEYILWADGDTLKGAVVSPAGKQEVTGARQESLRLLGDESQVLHRSWRGVVENRDGTFVMKTREGFDTYFTNADEFIGQLKEMEGKTISVTGWWVKTKIKIEKIEIQQ